MIKPLFAVNTLHQNGVGHFDLKPENILMKNNFEIVLTDLESLRTFLEASA